VTQWSGFDPARYADLFGAGAEVARQASGNVR
jgi:hypothetical protein